ncbi:hypothetical protein H7U20_17185, partial [Rugamonas sp. CCM 8940]|uniref:hypothetical protein n=1 Tax=Rugamonas sp. CCM 8940 TaxID=2765359 RepID=UPI0018F3C7A1
PRPAPGRKPAGARASPATAAAQQPARQTSAGADARGAESSGVLDLMALLAVLDDAGGDGGGAGERGAPGDGVAERGPAGSGPSERLSERLSMLAESGLDLDALAIRLLPPGGDDGIFEVVLPNGQKMGVAVHLRQGMARFHLSPFDDKLGGRLRAKKMELQGLLARHMNRDVEVTVL